MKANFDVGGKGYFIYRCEECGYPLDCQYKTGNFKHPTHDGMIFKGKPITCSQVGKVFKAPFHLIELTEEP